MNVDDDGARGGGHRRRKIKCHSRGLKLTVYDVCMAARGSRGGDCRAIL